MSRMQRCAELQTIPGQHRFKRIFRVMDLPRGMAKPAGWWAVAPHIGPDSHYWDGKAPAPYPPRPGEGWVFDFSAMAWAPDAQVLWGQIRQQRDQMLVAADWRVLPDSPMTEAERALWHAYRQALRDITDQPDPLRIVWPAPPA